MARAATHRAVHISAWSRATAMPGQNSRASCHALCMMCWLHTMMLQPLPALARHGNANDIRPLITSRASRGACNDELAVKPACTYTCSTLRDHFRIPAAACYFVPVCEDDDSTVPMDIGLPCAMIRKNKQCGQIRQKAPNMACGCSCPMDVSPPAVLKLPVQRLESQQPPSIGWDPGIDVARLRTGAGALIIQGDGSRSLTHTTHLPRHEALNLTQGIYRNYTRLHYFVVRGVRISGTRGQPAIAVGSGATLHILRCMLDNNTGARNGAGIYAGRSSVLRIGETTISGCRTLTVGLQVSMGGGVYGGRDAIIHISSSKIVSNVAKGGYGGGIACPLCVVVNVTDASAIQNNHAADGGGIYASIITIAKHTNVSNNEAILAGGGVYTTGKLNVVGASVVSNSAKLGTGGGIFGNDSTTIRVLGSNITANMASEGGGVYGSRYANISVLDASSVSDNTAKASGGGIYASDDTHIVVGASQVAGNRAGSDVTCVAEGGGLFVGKHSTLIVEEASQIISNIATHSAGGIHVGEYSSVQLRGGSSVTNNKAKLNGGGVYLASHSGAAVTKASLIAGNVVDRDGGGVFGKLNNTIGILSASISNNTAREFGGGIFGGFDNTITMYASSILDNSARLDGGGVCVLGSIHVNTTKVEHNRAGRAGGGIYGGRNSTTHLTNASISDNEAVSGGGLYVLRGVLTSQMSQIMHNSALSEQNSASTLHNAYGGGIYTQSSTVNLSATNVSNNQAIMSMHTNPRVLAGAGAMHAECQQYVHGAQIRAATHAEGCTWAIVCPADTHSIVLDVAKLSDDGKVRLRDSNGATARFLTARMSSSASHVQVPGPRAQLQVRKLASTGIPTGADGDDHAAEEGLIDSGRLLGCTCTDELDLITPGECQRKRRHGECHLPQISAKCRRSCGTCKWRCTRGPEGNPMANALDQTMSSLAASSPNVSMCAALKEAGLCGLVRQHGVCNHSCPVWPNGCQDNRTWEDRTNKRTCASLEYDRQCSLATLDNLGPGWISTSDLDETSRKACCQCGGGIYPHTGEARNIMDTNETIFEGKVKCVSGKARGGGMYSVYGRLTLSDNTHFKESSTTAFGGDATGDEMYVESLSYLSIMNTSFVQNDDQEDSVLMHSMPQTPYFADCGAFETPCGDKPGTYCMYNMYSLHCAPCDAGKVPTTSGQACATCASGKHVDNTDTTRCRNCDAGKYGRDGNCFKCATGTVPMTNKASSLATGCVACSRGELVDSTNSSRCLPCNVSMGMYEDGGVCKACRAGKMPHVGRGRRGRPSATMCVKCIPGMYNSNTQKCHKCPAGKFTAHTGALECTECAGSQAQGQGALVEAIVDKARTKCTQCTQYQSARYGALNVSCVPESPNHIPARCQRYELLHDCVTLKSKLGTPWQSRLEFRQGWHMHVLPTPANSSIAAVFECPHRWPEPCTTAVNATHCLTGYTGLLCTECEEEYHQVGNNHCRPDTGCTMTHVMCSVTAFFLLALALDAKRTWKQWRSAAKDLSSESSEREAGMLASLRVRDDPIDTQNDDAIYKEQARFHNERVFMQNALVAQRVSRTRRANVRAKLQAERLEGSWDHFKLLGRLSWQSVRVLMGWWQVMTQLGPVLDNLPHEVTVILGWLEEGVEGMAFARFDFQCVGLSGTERFYFSWWLRVVGLPVLLLGFLGADSILIRIRSLEHISLGGEIRLKIFDPLPAEEAKRRLMSWSNKLFFVLFLFYPMWANAALTMFDCRDLGDGMRVVREEYMVHCDGVVYTLHCVAAASMLLVVAVIPVVVMWKMTHVSKQEDDEDDDEDDRERSERDYLARRITEQLAVPKRKVEDLIKDLTDHSSYSFLAQGFRPACAYWENVDMIRKLVVVVLAFLLSKGSASQLVAVNFVSVIFTGLQIYMAPYRFLEDNVLKLVCELVIFGTITIDLALKSSACDSTMSDMQLVQESGRDAACGPLKAVLTFLFIALPLCVCVTVIMKAMRVWARRQDMKIEVYHPYEDDHSRPAHISLDLHPTKFHNPLSKENKNTSLLQSSEPEVVSGRRQRTNALKSCFKAMPKFSMGKYETKDTPLARAFQRYSCGTESTGDKNRLKRFVNTERLKVRKERSTHFDLFVWSGERQREFAQLLSARVTDQSKLERMHDFTSFPMPSEEYDTSREQEELREHALAHASVVVLLLSKHDVDTIETLSQRLASNQEITNLRGFKTIVELVVILELVHRRVVRKLVPLLVATSDHMSKTTDFKALDLTKLALRRIKDIASTQVQATSKEILGRMTKDSELHLWESQITLRGLVHAATDNNNRDISVLRMEDVAREENLLLSQEQQLEQAIARRVLQHACDDSQNIAGPSEQEGGEHDHEYYGKYTGYDGAYCTDRQLDLQKLVPVPIEPHVEVSEWVEREHTEVPHGEFGASYTEFTTHNYKITATPAEEFRFAYLEPNDVNLPQLDLGWSDGEALGARLPRKREIHWRRLENPEILCKLLNASLKEQELDITLEVEDVRSLEVSGTELMLATMYTGPMFVFYNAVTRAMGSGGVAQHGLFEGQTVTYEFTAEPSDSDDSDWGSVCSSDDDSDDSEFDIHVVSDKNTQDDHNRTSDSTSEPSSGVAPRVHSNLPAAIVSRFAYSIHGIAECVGKLSLALPTKKVYRGFAEMRLPEAFCKPDKYGVCAGADYGFTSTTLEQSVALSYSQDTEATASTMVAIQMDEANRGALVAFLSYYPEEREILFAPLARLEVRGQPEKRQYNGRELMFFQMQVHTKKQGGSPRLDTKTLLAKLRMGAKLVNLNKNNLGGMKIRTVSRRRRMTLHGTMAASAEIHSQDDIHTMTAQLTQPTQITNARTDTEPPASAPVLSFDDAEPPGAPSRTDAAPPGATSFELSDDDDGFEF